MSILDDMDLSDPVVVRMEWQDDKYDSGRWLGEHEWQCACEGWNGRPVAPRRVHRRLNVKRGQILTAVTCDACERCGCGVTVMFVAHDDGSVEAADEDDPR